MTTDAKTEEKIARLSVMERNLEQLGMQKRQFQVQLVEIESALSELEKSGNAFKIIGNIMVATEKDALKKELLSRKEMLDIRIKSFDKQETKLREQTSAFQNEIISELGGKDKND